MDPILSYILYISIVILIYIIFVFLALTFPNSQLPKLVPFISKLLPNSDVENFEKQLKWISDSSGLSVVSLYLIGPSGVGKSTFLHTVINRIFNDQLSITIGADRGEFLHRYNRTNYHVRIIDIGGHQFRWLKGELLQLDSPSIFLIFLHSEENKQAENEKYIEKLSKLTRDRQFSRQVSQVFSSIAVISKSDIWWSDNESLMNILDKNVQSKLWSLIMDELGHDPLLLSCSAKSGESLMDVVETVLDEYERHQV